MFPQRLAGELEAKLQHKAVIASELAISKPIWHSDISNVPSWRELIHFFLIPPLREGNQYFHFDCTYWTGFEKRQMCAVLLALRGRSITAAEKLLPLCIKYNSLPADRRETKQFRLQGGTVKSTTRMYCEPIMNLASAADNPFVLCSVSTNVF